MSSTRLHPVEEHVNQESNENSRWLCVQGVPQHDRSQASLTFDFLPTELTKAQLSVFKTSTSGTGGFIVSARSPTSGKLLRCGGGRFPYLEETKTDDEIDEGINLSSLSLCVCLCVSFAIHH